MAEGDLILSNGTAISPEDIRLIASEAKKILASESREIMEYEEVFSLSRISSFPAVYQQGTSFKLVRIAMNLLKGLDGKNVELMSTSESVLWRKEGDSDWKILTSLSSLKGDKGAPGEPVILRKSEAGIDWKLKNEPDSSWQNIVNIDDIKLKYSDLSSSDKSELTKIPVLDDVSAKKGSEPSGEFNFVGLDDKGNPQYRLNLTLPKGDSGLPPQIEIGSVETSLPDTFAEVSLTESGVSEEGRPVYMINFKIPAGRPGQDGNGAGNVYVKTDNIQSGHNYVFQAGANNSANGSFIEIGNIELGVGKTYPDTVNGEIFNDYENNIAFGKCAHAEGQETNATGPRTHAEGYQTKVFAADAHAEGRETWCLGSQGHAEGFYSMVYGNNSHVEGCAYDTDSSSPATRIMLATEDEEIIRNLYATEFIPFDKVLNVPDSFFEKYIIHASFGERSHVEGTNNICLDNSSHVEGFCNRCGNMITGMGHAKIHNANHIEGQYNYIGGTLEYTYSIHVEGNNNEFRGKYDYPTHAVHIEGHYNTIPLLTDGVSSCNGAHLGGEYSKILGGRSTFAHGYNLSVKNNYEAAFGKFNASEVEGKSVLFSYGIGTSDSNRKNAISIFSDGSVEIPKLISSTEGLDEKVEQLEKIISDNYTALSYKITGILNLLSTDNIDKKVFVVADSLVITYKVDANVEGDTLIINDYDFSVEGDNLIYESIVRAYVTDNNLFITDSIDAKVDESELIIQDEKINVVNNNLNII